MVFDTHKQELNDDLLKSAVVITPDGKQLAPTSWDGDPPRGHHRKGKLRFNTVKPKPRIIELRVTRAGEQGPRVFKWNSK